MERNQVIQKPWGSETLIEVNDAYVVKRLMMYAGHACSLQYHNFKHETFYVTFGKLKFTRGTDEFIMEPGDSFVIQPGTVHRMEALEDSIYIECSTPHLDDVVRLDDSYGRV